MKENMPEVIHAKDYIDSDGNEGAWWTKNPETVKTAGLFCQEETEPS